MGMTCARNVAAAEAKLQLGASNVDTQMQDIEREAMDIQLQDKLLEYKQSMGMLGSGSSASSKQIGTGSTNKTDEHVLDDVIVNEINEAKQSN